MSERDWTDDQVKAMARELAWFNGYNPDGAAGGPGVKIWETLIPRAKEALAAISRPAEMWGAEFDAWKAAADAWAVVASERTNLAVLVASDRYRAALDRVSHDQI